MFKCNIIIYDLEYRCSGIHRDLEIEYQNFHSPKHFYLHQDHHHQLIENGSFSITYLLDLLLFLIPNIQLPLNLDSIIITCSCFCNELLESKLRQPLTNHA